ncbi:DDE-type integrase/transposase/recombinase [Microbacterium oxydans]|nr:DDE-type integrase/transposase/recombinase [Microbacterium oxydans]
MRPPGAWEQRQRIAGTWAGQYMIDQERLDRHRLAQPYIFPERITTDNGKIYRSEAFRRGCERAGISLIFAARETGTDKPHVERTFHTMKTRFVQYLEGFTGGSVEQRGRDEPTDRALAVSQLQEMLEDWVAIEWQNRPREGLTDPMLPGRALTPNEMFRAYRRLAPELHVPFGLNEFIGFLPAKTCTLQDYGINHNNRVYNSKRLTELRAAGAGGRRRDSALRDPARPA